MKIFKSKTVYGINLLFNFQSHRRQYIATNIGVGKRNSKMKFKCTAKIGNGYWQSVEENTVIRRQILPLESRSSASSGT